jgi:hypothetical protein
MTIWRVRRSVFRTGMRTGFYKYRCVFGRARIASSQNFYGNMFYISHTFSVAILYEGNEPSDCIKGGKFLD